MSKYQKLHQNLARFYGDNARPMPWRERTDPYSILVSEMMLQQTQVGRVIPKFQQFMKEFPSIEELAKAPQSRVLKAWSGLGYNRRARYLHLSAKQITEAGGIIPDTVDELVTLPGIGVNTAGAIVVYAFNKPAVFIETNVRSVFIYEFFKDKDGVSDTQIAPLIEQTMDKDNPRQWYWAVMDYGAWLKRNQDNSIRKSSSYNKQPKFEGSLRQLRGRILKELADGPTGKAELSERLNDERLPQALKALQRDGLVIASKRSISLVD